MRRLLIGGTAVQAEAGELAERLAEAFARREHPLCLCCPGGVPMYVARAASHHILKRMPGSGSQHDCDCDSYEPPHGLSGLGNVGGDAIVENVEEGVTLLRLDFSLSKVAGRAGPAAQEASDAGAAKTDGTRLSLKALLHYLWDQAEFNRWRPAMSGKRNWAVVRKFLAEAAEGKSTKGKPLADVLHIPEMFDAAREAAIGQRRSVFLSRAIQSDGKRRTLAVLIGEVKEITSARFGFRMIVKHMPGFPFMLATDVQRRMNSAFASELALWNAAEDSHLVAAATFGIDAAGIASVEAVALMVVSDRWVPIENRYDAMLVETLTRSGASFLKSLRYSLPASEPMASVVLRRDGAPPVAMYIVPEGVDASHREKLDALVVESAMPAWIWEVREGAMPTLPE